MDEALYKEEPLRKKREEFKQQRFNFLDSQRNLPSANLAKYNLISNEEDLKKAIEENKKDW